MQVTEALVVAVGTPTSRSLERLVGLVVDFASPRTRPNDTAITAHADVAMRWWFASSKELGAALRSGEWPGPAVFAAWLGTLARGGDETAPISNAVDMVIHGIVTYAFRRAGVCHWEPTASIESSVDDRAGDAWPVVKQRLLNWFGRQRSAGLSPPVHRRLVYRFALNVAREKWRPDRSRLELLSAHGGEEACEVPAPPEDAPEHRALAEEDRRRLRECLDALLDRQREVIMLRFEEGLTLAQVAAKWGLAGPSSVVWHVDSALSRLRDCLDRGGGYVWC